MTDRESLPKMDVQVETPGGLARRVHITVGAERVERAYEDRIKQLATRVRVPGFRPGKAPIKVIKQQYGDSARAEAINDIVRETWPQALTQTQINPAGAPQFEIRAEKPGEALSYTATFEVYPDVKLEQLGALAVQKPVVEVTEADVDRLVENLRKSRRTWGDAGRPAQSGDQVVVDFVGRLDGEEFQGGKGDNVEIEIGANQFLPDLENALIGHAKGDAFTADVHFPDDYRAEPLRGKTAQFEVNLKDVRAAQLPAVDAEFLKAHGVDESAGEAGLRTKCRTALEGERNKAARNRIKQQILDELLKHHPIDVPQVLVTQEIDRLRNEAAERMGLNRPGSTMKASQLPAEIFEPNARRRVALGILVGEAIRAKDIKLDAARVEKALEEIAADYEHPDQVKQYYHSRQDLMQGLRAVVMEEQLVEALLDTAQASEQPMALEELLKPQQAPA
jgi:trigger factor